MLAPYLTITSRPEFSRNKTGFGYMVYDIATSVGALADVEVLASDACYKAFEQEEVRFLGVSYGKILRNLFCCVPISVLFSLFKKYKMPLGSAIRLVYYWLLSGYVSEVVSTTKYDIVHIHGCGFFTEIWMQVCHRLNQRYIVTLHGFNSFSDTVHLNAAGKKYERDFLSRVADGEFPITVISTGMKRLIEKTYNKINCPNISVVCNSFSFVARFVDKDINTIRKKYQIPSEAKVILYVGNISRNKNQLQMVEAFGMLPTELAEKTWVLFCGADNDSSVNLKDAILTLPYSVHLICCGAVPKEKMPDYYLAADAVTLLSYAEGFGLSLIEGMHFGLPCMMFTDMDAFEDIYDDKAVVALSDRNTQSIAEGMELLLTRQWDKDTIVSSSKRFESASMAQNYYSAYKNSFLR